jgi:hypothetical protein
MRALSARMKFGKVPSKYAEHMCQELMHRLSVRVIGTDAYAQHAHQKLNDTSAPKKFNQSVYISAPKSPYPERLYGVQL